jgi:hypothetical protein
VYELRQSTRAAAAALVLLVLAARPAAAQTSTPGKLSTLFEDIFGPTGLVVNSEAVLPDGTTHSAHFNSAFQSNFTQFNVALVSQLTALPLPSPASGFTYAFDPSTGTFKRSTRSFGPILTDRAETIGKGRLSIGFNYQYFSFDSIEGIDLGAVPAVFKHDDVQLGGGRFDVVTTANSVEATVSQWTGAVTYGITDRVDVSLAVPVVRTALSVVSNARIVRIGTGSDLAVHFFRDPDAKNGFGDHRQFTGSGSASGVGDLIFRIKGTAFREGHRALAAGLDVRAPTGDERNLLGAGAPGLKPFVTASFAYDRLSPRVNLSYQWNGRSVLAGDLRTGHRADLPDQMLYAAGTDIGVNERLSLAVDLIGQHVFDSPRLQSVTYAAPGSGSQRFADIAFATSGIDVLAGSAGFKLNVTRRVLANFNLRFNIAGGGLRDRVTPLLGIELGS